MEFKKERVYSSVNADELRAGDWVIVADDMLTLKAKVLEGFNWYVVAITSILGEEWYGRFDIDKHNFPLAYLVERKENCTNCGEGRWDAEHKKILCDPINCGKGNVVFRNHEIEVCEYWKPKTKQKVSKICINCEYSSCSYSSFDEERFFEGYCKKHDRPVRYDGTCPDYCLETEQKADKDCDNCGQRCDGYGKGEVCSQWESKAEKHTDYSHCEEARKAYICAMTNACPEKHYRPFKDTDELIKVWGEKGGKWQKRELTMPYIWVRYKNLPESKGMLIDGFEDGIVYVMCTDRSMQELFDKFAFLDGSPCGVEE